MPVSTDVFRNGEDLLASFSAGRYHLIIVDMYAGNPEGAPDAPRGLSVMHRVRQADPYAYTVFISPETDYAIEAYRLRVRRFLEKPVSMPDVISVLKDAAAYASLSHREMLCLNKKEPPVDPEAIMYIEQHDHILTAVLKDGSRRSGVVSLRSVLARLEGPSFSRCHKSLIVNFAYVAAFREDLRVFEMVNGDYLQIGQGRLSEAVHRYRAASEAERIRNS